MTALIRLAGVTTLALLSRLGRAFLLLLALLPALVAPLRRLGLLSEQLFRVGVLTLPVILVAGLFVGMVLGLQGYNTLVDFGAESSLGLLVALSLTRELGPVLTALLFAGRAGAALTAELGLMQATEQLAAMEMMAVDPLRRVLAPRLLAGLIAVPLLTAIFIAVGIYGGQLIGVQLLGVDDGIYWSTMREGVDLREDILNGIVKSLVFGVIVTWIAIYQGYDARPTAEGVARATTTTVVASSLLVLGLDFSLTSVMF